MDVGATQLRGEVEGAVGGLRPLKPRLSLVVSVFNEEEILPRFIAEAKACLAGLAVSVEFLFVNDGSTDRSGYLLEETAQQDQAVKVINLARNFGHEAAMIAGIDHASGEAVICIDADLQHPLEKITDMLSAFEQGSEVITMVRVGSGEKDRFRQLTSRLFYRVLNTVSPIGFEPNASDYFLISRRVAELLKSEFRERIRFLRGYIQIVGFRKTTLTYHAGKRSHGVSKYSLRKLFNLSVNALFLFSHLPLRLGIILGSLVSMFSILVGIYSIIMKLLGNPPPGYTTLVVLVSFLFAIQFFITGIIGEYIGYIFTEVQRRPLYIVDSRLNCRSSTHAC